MILTNRVTEIGDVLRIQAETAVIGIVTLQSFVDTTVNEIVNRNFKKSFRYSIDGINWSDYILLTNDNLAGIVVQPNDTFYAEYLYERVGTDPSSYLEFDSVTLRGEFQAFIQGSAYNDSIFSSYFDQNNTCSIAWSVNVLEKLYKKGIIPNYIERGLTGNNLDDRDFIDFWRAITHYFALYVCLARKFQYFYQNRNLLLEYIKQKGLFVCNDIDFVDLTYLMNNFYDEVRQRGTRQIFKPKADDIAVTGSKQVDGEYLRMICYDNRDELIINLNKNKHIGWNIGNSSPLYRGLEDRLNCNKYYFDYIGDITNLTNDLSLQPGQSSNFSIHTDSVSSSHSYSRSIQGVDVDSIIMIGAKAQLGGGDRRIVVNPNIDYEFTFSIKAVKDKTQTFGVFLNCYDQNDNIVNAVTFTTLLASSEWINGTGLNKAKEYYFVRGIIYGQYNGRAYDATILYPQGTLIRYSGTLYKAKRNIPLNGTVNDLGTINTTPGITLTTNPILWDFWQALTAHEEAMYQHTNLGVGQNLVFNSNIVKVDPIIICYSSDSFQIYNLRFQPVRTQYSKGFVGISNLLEMWNSNHNLNTTEVKINKDASKYLLPYDTVLKNNFLQSAIN